MLELEAEGEAGLVQSLIANYQENATKLLEKILQETINKNTSQIEISLHSLKSSSALLGLEKLSRAAGVLEDRIDVQFPTEDEVQNLQRDFREALAALAEFRSPSAL